MHGARPTGGTSIWHYTIIRPSAWDSHAERELGSRTSKQSHDRSAVPRRHLPELYESGVTALLGLAIATLVAYLLGADRTLIRDGLFGFKRGPDRHHAVRLSPWDRHVAVYIILGAIVSAIAMMGRETARRLGHDTADRPIRPDGLAAAVRPLPVRPAAPDGADPPDADAPGRHDPDRPARGPRRRRGCRVDGGQSRQPLVSRDRWGVPPGQPLDRSGLRDAILVNSRTCFVFASLGSALGGMTAL